MRPNSVPCSYLLALALLLWTATTTSAATVSFVPSAAEVACDGYVDIEIVVDGVADLRGFTLEIEFNPSLLSFVSALPGSSLLGAACPYFFHAFPMTTTISAVQFDGAPLGCSVSGPAPVATLRFQGLQEGVSVLDCRSLDLRNSLNLPIAATCTPGLIQVSCPVNRNILTWSTMKSSYR